MTGLTWTCAWNRATGEVAVCFNFPIREGEMIEMSPDDAEQVAENILRAAERADPSTAGTA